MGKKKIYDKVFYKINLVLGGRLTPEEFTEELSAKIRGLEAQVNAMGEMLGKQESRYDRIEKFMGRWAKVADRCTKLMDTEMMLINNQMVFTKAVETELKRWAQREEHTV